MTFRVGQKVVFVGMPGPTRPDGVLVEGTIYTVHGFCNGPHKKGVIGIFVCEAVQIKNLPEWCDCFHPDAFRPVVERGTKTGMAILRKLLKTKQREDA